MPTGSQRQPAAPPGTLFLIRLSLMTAVLLFGGITWYLHSSGSAERLAGPEAETVGWVVITVWAAAAAGIIFMGGRYRAAPNRAKRVTIAIVGWAMGEAAAFAGGIHYFLTGDPSRYGMGVVIFALALLLFPIPPAEPRLVR